MRECFDSILNTAENTFIQNKEKLYITTKHAIAEAAQSQEEFEEAIKELCKRIEY